MRAADNIARRRFGKFAAAGIFFQGGAAAIDTGTIVATLVHGLTGAARSRSAPRQPSPAPAGWCLNSSSVTSRNDAPAECRFT
jgi:hypothetical protein